MSIPQKDIDILRQLATRVAELSETKRNKDNIEKWMKLTDLDKNIRPTTLVHLWPLAWSEILPEPMECSDPTAQIYERNMKERIWSIENLQDDGVIEPIIYYPHCVELTPYEHIGEVKEYAAGDEAGEGACKFVTSINEEKDIDKIGDPIINVDFEKRNAYKEEAEKIFEGILQPIPWSMYFAAKVVDEFVALRGMENVFMDIMDRPEWLHEAFRRICNNFKKRFQTLEELGVWGSWAKSDPLGSTGLRFNKDLPNYDETVKKGKLTLADSWAFTCAEGFECVSPMNHAEFSLEYDRELMSLFKYVNVGCCEVLSSKIEYVKQVPNVRRISISEWCDFEKAGAEIGKDLIYGYKPAGVPFVGDALNESEVRKEIARVAEASKGCTTEMILNIGGTLGGGDVRSKLIRWTEIANEEIDKVYK